MSGDSTRHAKPSVESNLNSERQESSTRPLTNGYHASPDAETGLYTDYSLKHLPLARTSISTLNALRIMSKSVSG